MTRVAKMGDVVVGEADGVNSVSALACHIGGPKGVTPRYLAKAAPSFLVIMALGKFHGVMMPATPIGCLMNIICLELLTAGTTYLLGSYTNVEIT